MDGITVADGLVKRGSKSHPAFSYEQAFGRNLGWLTEWEQQALRYKRVAIAGMGGVGGFHLLTLVRFGIGAFNIADGDTFDLVNFNRQAGATIDSIGHSKVAVMADSARQVNPQVRINGFDHGLTVENLDAFLADVDLCIDGLDFFALDIRRKLNARCQELAIPVVNAAPLGMGTALLVFMPGGMSFDEWFRLDGLSEDQQYVSYLVGMAPSSLHRGYLVDPSWVDLRGHSVPSTVAGCELAAVFAGVVSIKLLLRRGGVQGAPHHHHFDAYRGRWVVRKLRRGNGHPLQRLRIALTGRFAARLLQAPAKCKSTWRPMREIEQILDYARWAPSGDNTQPWRFEILNESQLVVRLRPQPGDLYDYRNGEPTLLSGGMLLESIRIAATAWRRGFEWTYDGSEGDDHKLLVSLPTRQTVVQDPLLSYVPQRSVDRRRYRLQRLSPDQKARLAAALGPDLEVQWYEGLGCRWRLARLGAKATAIRMGAPEAFPIHQRVLDWDQQFSPSGIPAAASGISGPSLWLMRWAMRSWPRMRLLNAFGGPFAGAVQMDYVPGLFSAAFFTLRHTGHAHSDRDRAILQLKSGQAIQRFWLTATALGLAIQPAMAVLIFAHYGLRQEPFTAAARAQRRAVALARALYRMMRSAPDGELCFVGRIGMPRPNRPACRSIRLPLSKLFGPPVPDPGATFVR